MKTIRKAEDRGHFDHGWLQTWHTFSFADYIDPRHKRHSVLRVINDDIIEAGQGFGTHPHQDMEIFTWVISGALEHKDSTGNSSVIRPHEAQRMSAGTGIMHSEFNHSKDDPVRLLQIWIFPEEKGLAPGYEQKAFPVDEEKPLTLLASRDGADGSVTLHQDVKIYRGILGAGQSLTIPFSKDRKGWIQVAEGRLQGEDLDLGMGDGLALSGEGPLKVSAEAYAHVLAFDLPNQ